MKNLVLIHANSSSKNTFRKIRKFIDDDINIVSFNLPGHGDNQRNLKKNDLNFSSLLEYCLDITRELEGEVILYGNSLGGHLAIEVAPEVKLLKGIVLSGTPPLKKPLNMEEAFNPLDELSIFFKNETDKSKVQKSIDYLTENKDCVDEITQDYFDTSNQFRLRIDENVTNPDLFKDEFNIFCSISCEKLIVKGDSDKTTSDKYLEYVAKLSKCTIVEIDNCGHYPQIERPEEFSKILNDFSRRSFS